MEFFFPAQTNKILSQLDTMTLHFGSITDGHISSVTACGLHSQSALPHSVPELHAITTHHVQTPELSVPLHLQCIAIITITVKM